MKTADANILLTRAALIDPRLKRVDPEEQADMAKAWAEVLWDVDLLPAIGAVRDYYRTERGPIMPVDILDRVGRAEEPPLGRDIDEERRREALAALRAAAELAGMTPAEYAGALERQAVTDGRD